MSLTATIVAIVLIPAIIWLINRKLLTNKLKNVSVSMVSAIFLYIFILLKVVLIEQKLNNELASFDLNSDGVFSGIEITPDQEKAMNRVTSDTGRTFAPLTGAISSLIYFCVVWSLLSLISWVSNKRSSVNT